MPVVAERLAQVHGPALINLPPIIDPNLEPTRQIMGMREHAFLYVNRSALKGPQFPASGPFETTDTDLREHHTLQGLRRSVPLDPMTRRGVDPLDEVQRHFGGVVKEAFFFNKNCKPVALDAAYLIVDAGKGQHHVIDLSATGPAVLSSSLKDLQARYAESLPRLQLVYVAGLFDGESPRTVRTVLDGRLLAAPESASDHLWESVIALHEHSRLKLFPAKENSIAAVRAAKVLGWAKRTTLPEEALTAAVNGFVIPSPRLQVSPVELPEKPTASFVAFSRGIEGQPPVSVDRLKEATRRGLLEERDRFTDLFKSLAGRRILAATGDYVPRTKAHPAPLSNNLIVPWQDEVIEYFSAAGAADAMCLMALNHPAMLHSHLLASRKEFVPVRCKVIGPIDELRRRGMAVSYPEMGFDPSGWLGPDGIVESTTGALASFWSQSIMGKTTRPFMGSSMNSFVGSAHAIRAGVRAHMQMFIPCDGCQRTLVQQDLLYQRAIELLENDPVITLSPFGKNRVGGKDARDYAQDLAKSLIGVTLKPDPKDAIKRVKHFYEKYGVDTFRLYDAGVTGKMVETVRELRKHFGSKIKIAVGQVADSDQVEELFKIQGGVDALIVGVGDGGHCTTSQWLNQFANNWFRMLRIIQKHGWRCPVIADGGPGIEGVGAVLGTGGAAVMLSGAAFGGTREHPGAAFYRLANGALVKLGFGEANPINKYYGNQILAWGVDWQDEGVQSIRPMLPLSPHASIKLFAAFGHGVKALRFARYSCPDDARLDPNPPFKWGTATAIEMRNPHVNRPAPDLMLYDRGDIFFNWDPLDL